MFLLQLIWPSSRLLSPIGSLLTLNNWIKTKYGYLMTYTWVIKCAWHSKHLCIWSIIHIMFGINKIWLKKVTYPCIGSFSFLWIFFTINFIPILVWTSSALKGIFAALREKVLIHCYTCNWMISTVKLGKKERLDKEQFGIKEPFPVTNLPFTS